jgi:hypothetical protein
VRFSQPRSLLLGVAVVLAAAAPAHASRADAHGNPRAMRDQKVPAKHRLGGNDTGNSLSRRYYGSSGGALTILWSNGLKRWPPSKRVVASKRYRAGDIIVIRSYPSRRSSPPRRVFRA